MPRKVFTETEPFKETLFLISFIKKHHKTGAYVLVFLGHFQKCLTAFFYFLFLQFMTRACLFR
jgi:late competence protein required for DNA uptake (superfamily II DNA/RNA helicase)